MSKVRSEFFKVKGMVTEKQELFAPGIFKDAEGEKVIEEEFSSGEKVTEPVEREKLMPFSILAEEKSSTFDL